MPDTETNGAARWIFHLQVNNRPGVLSAVTAIFADRGFSIQTLTAHDSGDMGTTFGAVLLTFTAPAVKKDYLARILSRSAMVQHVTIYRYEDAAHARKSISVRVAMSADALKHALPEALLCDIVSSSPSETLAVLLGPPVLVDQAPERSQPDRHARIDRADDYGRLIRNINYTPMIETPTIPVPTSGIRRLKEPFCALSHYAGTVFGLAATTLLLLRSAGHFWPTVGCVIYGVSLTLMYLASALSHTWHAAPHVQIRFSQFDYIAIALLIAGTYAPLCLVTLHGILGWAVLAFEYGLASIVIANVVFRDRTPHWMRVILYMFMGWAIMLVWKPVMHSLPHDAAVWMVTGGILYSIGVAVLGSDRPHLWPGRFSAHDLWHIFVIAGSACHFWLIWRYIA